MYYSLEKDTSYSDCDWAAYCCSFIADLINGNLEKGNKYPQVNPSQSQVSKYFFFYLNMVEISHLLFRCTAFTTVKGETEGDKKANALNTFLSDSTVLIQGPNSFLSLRTFNSLH